MNYFIKRFIGSDFFEYKCIWLRRNIKYFSRLYNIYHDINILEQGGENDNSILKSQRVLSKLISPLQSDSQELAVIPKIIWIYWNKPIDMAPEVVQLSVRSWRELNPDYEVKVLTDDNLQEIIGFDFHSVFKLATIRLSMAVKADVLRLYLLARYGGVWVDATTFCLKPLKNWLLDVVEQHHFFCFRHKTNHTRPIEVWFLAAPPNSAIILNSFKLFTNHIFKARPDSLFSSNKRKMMEKIGIKREHKYKLYADTVYKAESFGFMPYFSLGYFFNESLRLYYSPEMMRSFYDLPNCHAINGTEYDDFLSSFVSKQTYKGSYQLESVFLKRKEYLISLLNKK